VLQFCKNTVIGNNVIDYVGSAALHTKTNGEVLCLIGGGSIDDAAS
jgi:hypothetical protein